MSTVIFACTSLRDYVNQAQKILNTSYPVVFLDRKLHSDPHKMRDKILEEEKALPKDVDTVLVAMGFCGGSWDQVIFPRRTVIPRVDDCITLLLQKEDTYCPNLKKMGHMYMAETDPSEFDWGNSFQNMPEEFEEFDREELLQMFFGNYSFLDIVDTGLNDCYSESYVEIAQRNADIMKVSLDYVEGSNHILEKLIRGDWDEQFLVALPGHEIRHADFFD